MSITRTCTCIVILLLTVGFGAPAARGALVIRKDGSSVLGFLVSEGGQAVVLRERLADGSDRETSIPRSEVDELILTVLPERLAALAPDQPHLYREYAEELAEKRRDPEAREAALRLYQIAATLAPQELGRSALLGMIALARSPQEEARFRAAAYLLDPAHAPSLLKPLAAVRMATSSAPVEALPDLLRALKTARRGRGAQAKTMLERPGVKAQLQAFEPQLTLAEFYAACGLSPPTDEQLEKLLGLELTIEAALAGEAATQRAAAPAWSVAIARDAVAPFPSLGLDKLTEFDPRACLFRNGRWVTPGSTR